MHNIKSRIWSQQPGDPEEPRAQSLLKASSLQTQEEPMFQFKSVGRRKLMFQLKAGGQRNSLLHENQTVCFIQAFNSLAMTHPHQGVQSAILSQRIQESISFKNTLTETPRKMFDKCLCKHSPSKVHNKTLSITFS